MEIRRAEFSDLEAITAIYNEAVLNTAATFDTVEKTMEQQAAWFRLHDARHPILVAVEGSEVIGWASLKRWSDRIGYAETVEDSIYIKRQSRGQGIGKLLLARIVEEAEREKYHTIIARISGDNAVSIHIHEKAGFVHAGMLKEVGRKFGKFHDVHIMQKMMDLPSC